jgi:hypothetical protein
VFVYIPNPIEIPNINKAEKKTDITDPKVETPSL